MPRRPRARRGPAQRRLSYSALQAYARCGYRFYLAARARPAGGAATAAADEAPAAAARGAALDPRVRGTLAHSCSRRSTSRRPAPPDARGGGRARRAARRRAHRGRRRGHRAGSSARSRARRCARGSPERDARPPRGRLRVRARAGRRRPARQRLRRRDRHASPTARALIVDYKTDRLDGADPAEVARARLRDPAHGLRARRAARRRARASTSPTASSSARASRSSAASPPPTRDALAEQARLARPRRAGRALPGHGRAPPRALRRLPRPAGALLVARGADAARAGADAGRLLGLRRLLGRQRRPVVARGELRRAAQVDRPRSARRRTAARAFVSHSHTSRITAAANAP